MSRAATPSVLRFWGWTAFVVSVLAFAAWFARDRHVARRWRETVRELELHEAALARRRDPRPRLYGEPVEGTAAARYERAIALATGPRLGELEVDARAARFEPTDALVRFVEEGAEVLALVGEGARAGESGWPVQVGEASNVVLPSRGLAALELPAFLALAASALAIHRGDHAAGVDRLLDALQYGRDLLQAPDAFVESVAADLLTLEPFHSFLRTELLARLSASERRRLRAGLEELIVHQPLASHAVDAHHLWTVRQVDFGMRAGLGAFVPPVRARIEDLSPLLSPRLFLADYYLAGRTLVADALAAQAEGLGRQAELHDEVFWRTEEEWSYLMTLGLGVLPEMLQERAHALARLRLLAGALALLDGDEPEYFDAFLAENVVVERREGALGLRAPAGPDVVWRVVLGTNPGAPSSDD